MLTTRARAKGPEFTQRVRTWVSNLGRRVRNRDLTHATRHSLSVEAQNNGFEFIELNTAVAIHISEPHEVHGASPSEVLATAERSHERQQLIYFQGAAVVRVDGIKRCPEAAVFMLGRQVGVPERGFQRP